MGKLTFENGKFWFEAANQAELDIAKKASFSWNEDNRQFTTRDPKKAITLRRFAVSCAEWKFKKHFITDREPPEQISYPDQLEPMLHQLESAWWCLTRTPAYVADEAGLGKTIMAILCMNSRPGPTLIICPPFLKFNWAEEIKKWSTDLKRSIMILGEKTKEQVRLHYDVMICPDSQLTNESIKTLIKSQKFTWLFVDEAHRYKEATTKRTQALLGEDNGTPGLIEAAQNVVFMSGTPFPNGRPIELFPLLDGAAPESIAYRDRIDFGTTFCDGKLVTRSMGAGREEHWNFTGASRLGELRQELRQRFMIRHTKKDCLKDLPPKTRKFVFLDQPDKLAKFSAQVLKEHTLEDLMGANHELGDIATYRREVGEAKVVQAFNYISELLENSDEKLVVFGHHVSVITDLARLLNRFHPIVVQGGMPAQRKAECVELFQKSKRHRVILGNMEAMGIGNTLTAAPGVIIVEPSWVPGINEQAEDRVHRMTQRQPVYIRYLVLRDSLDERMLRQVLAKEKNIQEIMS